MLAFFQRLSTARPLAVLIVLYILFPAAILPAAEAQMKLYSGGVGPIDLKFSYTPTEVFQMVAAYGEEGRAFYRILEMTLDVIYPIAYTLLFGALLTAVLRRAFPQNSLVHSLALLPAICFLLDMGENIGIITMLTQFPTQSESVAQITSFLTTLKWICFGAIIVTLVTGLVVLLVRRFTGRATPRTT